MADPKGFHIFNKDATPYGDSAAPFLLTDIPDETRKVISLCPCHIELFAGPSLPKVFEEGVVDVERSSRLQAELQLLEHVDQLLAINQLNWWDAVSDRFAAGIGREGTSCHNDPFVGSPLHGAPEVPDMCGCYCTGVALALEKDAKADEGVYLNNTIPVETAVSGTAGNRHVLEARLPKQPLAQTLKARGRQCLEYCKEASAVIHG